MVVPSKDAMITLNGVRRPLACTALLDLVRETGHDPERPGIAVAVNGEVIPRLAWARCALRSGDEIEIVGAVQGG